MLREMRFVLCAVVLVAAAAGVLSGVGADGAHDGAATTGPSRALLEAGLKPCPVDLSKANYTVLTSRCRWPGFEPKPCCAAFKELACPYAGYLNDLSTDCADILFRYIDLRGGYPPGIFYDNCKEGPKGLKCPKDQDALWAVARPAILL